MKKEKTIKTYFLQSKPNQQINSCRNFFQKGGLNSFLYLGNSLPIYNPKYNYFYNETSNNDNPNYYNTLSYYPSNSPKQFLKSKSVNILTNRHNQFKLYKEALTLVNSGSQYIINKSKHKDIFNKYDKQIENKYGKPKHDLIVLTTNPNKEFQFCPYDSFGNSFVNNDNNYFNNNIIEYIFENLNLMGIKHKFKQEMTLSDFLKITEKELTNMKINFDNVMKIQKFKKAFVNYLHTKDENDIININDIKNVINNKIKGDEERKQLSHRLIHPYNKKNQRSNNQYKTNNEFQFDNEVFVPSPKDKNKKIQFNKKQISHDKRFKNKKKIFSDKKIHTSNEKKHALNWPRVKLIKVNTNTKEIKKNNFIPNKKLRIQAEKLYDRYNLIISAVENYWNKTTQNQQQLSCLRQTSTLSFSSRNTACGSCK